MPSAPPLCTLDWPRQHRVVPSVHPPVDFFENLVVPELMEALWYLEGLTNDRLRDQTGDVRLVGLEDRVSGPGSTPVMAAFTHIGRPSRFSNGDYGVYYAARDLETAVRETAYHRARFLAYTREAPGEINMRAYIGRVVKALHDVRDPAYAHLHRSDDWATPQDFARPLREARSWGLVFHSVRHPGGQCIAAFRPPAVSLPVQGPHLAYIWNGRAITGVYEKSQLLFELET